MPYATSLAKPIKRITDIGAENFEQANLKKVSHQIYDLANRCLTLMFIFMAATGIYNNIICVNFNYPASTVHQIGGILIRILVHVEMAVFLHRSKLIYLSYCNET